MVVLLLLLAYTTCVVCFVPWLTAGRSWPQTSPRLGLLVCQAVPAAAVSGILLMASMIAVSVQQLRFDVGHLLHACAVAIWDSATYAGVPETTGLALLVVVFLAHLGRTAAVNAAVARRVRTQHRQGLALVADGADRRYTRVLSERPFAYCLPGKGGRIVVSSAAEQQLDAEQLAAVLAHERAHLRGRHHTLVQTTLVLSRALPLPSLRALHHEARALVELVADDRASRQTRPEALLGALLRLGAHRGASPGLPANGEDTFRRASRLAGPLQPQPIAGRVAICLGAGVLVVMPWLLGGMPVVLALTGHCDG